MIQLPFEVYSLTTATPRLVHNDDFLKVIMPNVVVGTDRTDDYDMFKDLFEN